MVARFHYEDDVYQQLLLDNLPPDRQSTVTAHVETCSDCQEKLESLSHQEDITWDDVRRYLAADGILEGGIESTVGGFADAAGDSDMTLGFLEPSETDDAIGTFGRYEIKEVLGRGGMGIVLRGFDPALNRHSAIKVLAPELATHSAARKRFSREAKSAAAVVHEHVVPIQTVDAEKGLPYFVMPVIEGRSLEQRVAERGPLGIKEVLRIGQQAARGLSAAHAQGLVHRDVKPANILLENGVERVMITDFGLARAADDASMTRSGVIAGTPQYMSPEQSRGSDIDARSDLFSLGSVLYFMCSGHSPFRAETTMGVLHRIVTDEPRSIRSVNPDIPAWMESIIDRLLNKEPDARFQSADDVADLLGRWLAHTNQPDSVPPPQPLSSERKTPANSMSKWIAGAMGALLLMFAAWTIVLELEKGTLTIESVDENASICITQNGNVVERLTVTGGKGQTRIAAGAYLLEIDGDDDTIRIDRGNIVIERGGETIARITHRERPVGPGPGVTNPRHGMPQTGTPLGLPGPPHIPLGASADSSTTAQLLLDGPAGATVQVFSASTQDAPVDWDALNREVIPYGLLPMDWKLALGELHRIEFTNLPGHAETRFHASLELPPRSMATKSYIANNKIPIRLTAGDIEAMLSGSPVTKVIYLPDAKHASRAIASIETLVSSRLDPGVDPIAEARSRGSILAILRWIDGVKLDAVADAGRSNTGVPLLNAIREFNDSLTRDAPELKWMPLTDDEVLAWARWNLRFAKSDSQLAKTWYRNIVEHRKLPEGTAFQASVVNVSLSGKAVLPCYRIHLNPGFDVKGSPRARYFIREQCLSDRGTYSSPGLTFTSPQMEKTLAEFNAYCKNVDPAHSPVTAQEILATLKYFQEHGQSGLMRESGNAYGEMIAECVSAMRIPDSVSLELSTEFGAYDGISYRIWAPSIRFRKSDGSGSWAFPIRHQFLSSHVHSDSDIRWGPAGTNGLQAGVRLSPTSNVYNNGQILRVEICYRTVNGKELSGILPNILSYVDVEAFDAAGKPLRTAHPSFIKMIAGATGARFGSGIVARDAGRLIIRSSDDPPAKATGPRLDDEKRRFKSFGNPETAYIYVDPSQSCRVRFVVYNHADEGEDLTTGYAAFTIASSSGPSDRELGSDENPLRIDSPLNMALSETLADSNPIPSTFVPTKVRLRVVDDVTNEPITNVKVGANFSDTDVAKWSDLYVSSTTRVNDSVIISLVHDGLAGKTLRVSADGYVPQQIDDRWADADDESSIEVRLVRGIALKGSVVDHSGKLTPATVCLVRKSHQSKSLSHREAKRNTKYRVSVPFVTSVRSDGGEFEITGLNEEQTWLGVLAPGRGIVFHELSREELESGSPLTIKLPEPGSVEVSIHDRRASTYVDLRQASGMPLRFITSKFELPLGEDGKVRIPGLTPGRYALSVMQRGKVRHVRTALREFEVKEGEATKIEFAPIKGLPLAGTLTGLTARKYEAASLTLTRKDNHTEKKGYKYIESDAAISIEKDGDFKTGPLREGWYTWHMSAYAPDNPNAPLRLPAYSMNGEVYIPDDEAPKHLEITIPPTDD